MYFSSKTYDHSAGLSCAFRQWRAPSHCALLHGYALRFEFSFAAAQLDDRNWVVDFGGLKDLRAKLQYWFDHTTVVASDDPQLPWFTEAHGKRILDLRILPTVGCEAFAKLAVELAQRVLLDAGIVHAKVISCKVCEHSGNSATYMVEL